MPRKSYCGVNNIALQIPDKGYCGIATQQYPLGVACKLIKGYCGDENGIAQQFWPSGGRPDYEVGHTYIFNLADLEEVWDYAVNAYVTIQDDYGTGSWLYREPLVSLKTASLKAAVFDKIDNHSVDFNAIMINILGSGIDRSGRKDSSYVKAEISLGRVVPNPQGTITQKSNAYGFDYWAYQYATSLAYHMTVTIRTDIDGTQRTITDISTSTWGNIYVGVYGYQGSGGALWPYITLSNIGFYPDDEE